MILGSWIKLLSPTSYTSSSSSSSSAVGCQELLQHNEKEAAAREESLAQAMSAAKDAREATLSRDNSIRTLSSELQDGQISIRRLEAVELSLREALQR